MSKHDSEVHEIHTLLDIVDFSDKHVLESDCGGGGRTISGIFLSWLATDEI